MAVRLGNYDEMMKLWFFSAENLINTIRVISLSHLNKSQVEWAILDHQFQRSDTGEIQ